MRGASVDVKVCAMVDVQDRDATVAAIRDVRRRFERGAPPPRAAVELLRQLHQRLADSGPFELGHRWLRALEICQQALERAESGSSRRAARQVRWALAALEAFFANSRWSWMWRSDPAHETVPMVIYAPLLIPLVILILALNVPISWLADRRAGVLADLDAAARSLELRDRVLLAARCAGQPSRERRMMVATDRGIVVARAENTRVRVERDIPYRALIAKKASERNVTIFATDRSSSYTVSSADLVKILQLRAPEALRDDVDALPAAT